MGHRRDVGLHEQVAREIGADVEQLETGDSRARRRSEQLPRRRWASDERRLEELCAELRREDLHQAAVALAWPRRRRLEQPRSAGRRRAALLAERPQCAGGEPRAGHRELPRELVRRVALVARERLVAAVTRERDRHVPARGLADEEERQRSVVAVRLVEGGGEPRQRVGDVLVDKELLVLRPVALCDGARVPAFVVAVVVEADGERAHRVRRRLRHTADDDARVDATREESAERDVRDQAPPHGGVHPFADEREPVAFALGSQVVEVGVALDAHRAALGDEHVARRQLLDRLRGPSRPGRTAARGTRRSPSGRSRSRRPGRGAVPSAPTRRRASHRRGASRAAASSRCGRARARAAPGRDPRARP